MADDILGIRRRKYFDKYGNPSDYPVSMEDYDYLTEEPAEPSLDTPNLGRLATDITDKKGEPTRNLRQMMDELYTPATESRDRFNRLLEEFPQREEPGFLRKLVASGASLGNVRRKIPGGLEAAENVMYAPYMRDVGAWKERAEPYAKAAEIERAANAAERQLAGNILTYETQAERNRIQEEKNQAAAESARIRALAYDFAQRHRGIKWDLSGPTIKTMDATGNIHDTGLPTGKLDEYTKIAMQNEGRLDVAKTVAGIRGTQIFQGPSGNTYTFDPTTKMWWDPVRMEWVMTPPEPGMVEVGTASQGPRAGTAEKPETEDQRREAEFRRAREMKAEFGDYIDLDEENSTYEVGVPGIDMFAGQETKDKTKEIERYIQGLGPKPSRGAPSGNIPPAAPSVTVPPQTVTPQVPPQIPPTQTAAPVPVVPQRTLPSSSAYGPGVAIPDVRNVPFQGPRQPPGPIVNPPSSSVYGPGATPRPVPGAIAPSPVPPPTATLQQRPTAKPGYVIIMKGGQIVGQIPETERDQAIREGYAVVR